MFPIVYPFYIPELTPLHPYATLVWLAGIVCLGLTRYTHQLGRRWGALYYGFSALMRAIGILLIAAGWLALAIFAALGVWSVLALGLRRSFLFRRVDAPLFTSGPYALVRHPQFLSAMGMALFGTTLFDPGAISWVRYGQLGMNTLLFILAFWILAILEDRELAAHFGERYEEYARRGAAAISELKVAVADSPSVWEISGSVSL